MGEFYSVELYRSNYETLSFSNEIKVRYSLNTSTSNLLAFSIYGNYYDGIYEFEGKGDGAASVTLSVLCSFICISGIFIFIALP